MTTIIVVVMVVVSLPLSMRGSSLHNWLVSQVAQQLRASGFSVRTEYACRLVDGRLDFLDVFAHGPAGVLACEIETSPRHVRTNAAKAAILNIPLWIVVPNRKTRVAVKRRLGRLEIKPGGQAIQFPLLGELRQALTNCFPLISAANRAGKKGKSIQDAAERSTAMWPVIRTNGVHPDKAFNER